MAYKHPTKINEKYFYDLIEYCFIESMHNILFKG